MTSLPAILLATPAFALDLADPRRSGAWISDPSDLLSAREETILNERVSDLVNSRDLTLLIALQPTVEGRGEDLARSLYASWGLESVAEGRAMVVSLDVAGAEVSYAIGPGLQGALPASWWSQPSRPFVAKDTGPAGEIAALVSELDGALRERVPAPVAAPEPAQTAPVEAVRQPGAGSLMFHVLLKVGGALLSFHLISMLLDRTYGTSAYSWVRAWFTRL